MYNLYNKPANGVIMKKEIERFDMAAPPRRTKWYLRPLINLLCLPDLLLHRNRLTKK